MLNSSAWVFLGSWGKLGISKKEDTPVRLLIVLMVLTVLAERLY